MIVPFCKVDKDLRHCWTYFDLEKSEILDNYEFAYCSLFHNEFAVFGLYFDFELKSNIQYGVLNSKMEVVVPPIYESLEFYPNSDSCFLGRINFGTYQRFEVIFDLKERFKFICYEVVPIKNKLFLLVYKDKDGGGKDIRIHRSNGEHIQTLPFLMNFEEPFDKEYNSENPYSFDKVAFSSDYFQLIYCKSGTINFGRSQYEDNDHIEYWFKNYYLNFDFEASLIAQSNNENEIANVWRSGWRNELEELKWLPKNVKPLSLNRVCNELSRKSLISFNKEIKLEFPEKYVFQTLNNSVLSEPKILIDDLNTSVWENVSRGRFIGNRYIDIFKYNYKYIEWIIKTWNISFVLENFFINGMPYKINLTYISLENQDRLYQYLKNNSEPSKFGDYLLTNKIIEELLEFKIIKSTDFVKFEYGFSDELKQLNNLKSK